MDGKPEGGSQEVQNSSYKQVASMPNLVAVGSMLCAI